MCKLHTITCLIIHVDSQHPKFLHSLTRVVIVMVWKVKGSCLISNAKYTYG